VSSPPDTPIRDVVAAAGGAVWRDAEGGGIEVVLVHRPRYDDWSLPKGKLDAGEHGLTAAVREVAEETGLSSLAGRRSVQVSYPVVEGLKRVDYWVMRALGGDFEPNHEVDELRWLPVAAAAELCSHEHDRAVLADLVRTDVPAMPTLLLVRHGRAGSRSHWDGPDDLRPLDRRGVAQARRLADVLPAFGPTEILSAPPVRCTQTVAPLAEALGLDVRPAPEMGEDGFAADPDAGLALVERLLAPRESPGVTVLSSQGGAIPSVLAELGVRSSGARVFPPAAKGSVWVLGGRPGSLLADYYRDLDPDPDAPASR
jgi:8-oxo-dGTP pyrophosphatase MutT (NUDIX family)/phosphohistidine phosphatase SixA